VFGRTVSRKLMVERAAVLLDAAAALKVLQRLQELFCRRHGHICQWFLVKRASTTRAGLVPALEPSQRMRHLQAAAEAACSDVNSVHRTAPAFGVSDNLPGGILHKRRMRPNN